MVKKKIVNKEVEYKLKKEVVAKMLDLYNDFAGVIHPEENKYI